MSDTVTRDDDGGVATLTLQRPGLSHAMRTDLLAAVEAVAADESVRALLITCTGRAFCVGQDLAEHARNLEGDLDAVWTTVPEHYTPIATTLATMPKPVIAAVNGVAAGAGAAFAFACDFRVVADTASFTMAFSAVGLSADSGSSWTLPRLVGMAKAKELLLLPSKITAAEALELGLATEVVPAEQVAGRARELAVRLAAGPTVAYGAIRRSLAFSAGHGIDESLDVERQMMELTGATHDHRDAVAAFLRKAAPTFEGH
jgi:2-(1,2-epoxy-1,2-dihydrophenyl)acetyl-CoA isomerase